MIEPNLALDQINQLAIPINQDLNLINTDNDSPTVEKEGQADKAPWVDAAWTDDYFTENKEALRVRSQKQDTTSQSRMRPDQTISNSVASWKLKYRLGAQTKKNFK